MSEDGSRAGCYRLCALHTDVKVQVNDGTAQQTISITLGTDPWLLFKLGGGGLDEGRRVQQVSSGSYLAIVPSDWRRDEQRAGTAPTTPECVFLEGHLAHFFIVESTTPVAFRDGRDEPIEIASRGPRFGLVGHQIHDASERVGPLFGGSLPRMQIEEGKWSDVGTIVVGQEGSGRRRWQKSFRPKMNQDEQELPCELLERRAGWYFVRFYDHADELIDSLDFRFVAGLQRILVPTVSPVPSSEGHQAQTVQIQHEPGYSVVPLRCRDLSVTQLSQTISQLTIPAKAGYDRTEWAIGPRDSPQQQVTFTVLIERLWWATGTGGAPPADWGDKPAPLQAHYFDATSDKAIWLRFAKPRWVSDVQAGFQKEHARAFQVRVADTTVAIPLRDFAGVQELNDRRRSHHFKVWLEIGQAAYEVAIAVLMASVITEGKGRYKSAFARVQLQHGPGAILVNGAPIEQYFNHAPPKAQVFLRRLHELDEVQTVLANLEIVVSVSGSSPTTVRQAKAVGHAIARTLWQHAPALKPTLTRAGFGGVSVARRKVRHHCQGE